MLIPAPRQTIWYARTATLVQSGADCVGGRQQAIGGGVVGQAYGVLTASRLGSGGAEFRSGHKRQEVDTVYLGAWPRQTFERFGFFAEDLRRNQDDEHNMRIRAGSGRILLEPAMKSSYQPRATLGALFRQYFGYGAWKPCVLWRHPRGLKGRHLLPPLMVFLFLGFVLAAVFGRRDLSEILGFGLMGYGILTAMVAIKLGQKIGSMLWLAVVALVMHVAYGTGFIVGLSFLFSRSLMAKATTVPQPRCEELPS